MAVCASTELSRAGLEEVLARTGGHHDVITNRTMADFVPRCGNERPDVASLGVQAAGTSARDAIADLSHMPPAVRLIGVCSRRLSARHAGEPRRLGMPKESPDAMGYLCWRINFVWTTPLGRWRVIACHSRAAPHPANPTPCPSPSVEGYSRGTPRPSANLGQTCLLARDVLCQSSHRRSQPARSRVSEPRVPRARNASRRRSLNRGRIPRRGITTCVLTSSCSQILWRAAQSRTLSSRSSTKGPRSLFSATIHPPSK